MPDLEKLAPAILIAALAVMLLWFTFGTSANIRKGNRVLRWLQDGLGVLGPRTTLRWLGSSVAELRLIDPERPFREALVMVVLEPRDLGALWALARSRGRRDFLVLRLSLLRSPMFRAEAVDPHAWTAGHLADSEDRPPQHGTWTDGGGAQVELRYDPEFTAGELQRLWERLRGVSGGAWRVSVRPTVPHVEIHLLLPDLREVSSRRLEDEVPDLALDLVPAR
jgi:hypothetical protein